MLSGQLLHGSVRRISGGGVCSLLAGRDILELLEHCPVAAIALLVQLFLFAGGLYLLRKYRCALRQNKENRK